MKFNLLFLIIMAAVLNTYCQETNNKNVNEQESYDKNIIEFYKDSTFLNIEGSIYEEPEIIYNNIKTYLQAYERMMRHTEIVDNQIVCIIKRGKDIQISENIFNYLTEIWHNDFNPKIKEGKMKVRKTDKIEVYDIKHD